MCWKSSHKHYVVRVFIKDAIGFSSPLLSVYGLPQICHFARVVGCFVRSAMVWAVLKRCCGAIEKIIGFSLEQFYADAIELVCGVKVRAILGPIQMRTGQYTLRQMSKPISSFSLTGENVCVCGYSFARSVDLVLCGTNEKSVKCWIHIEALNSFVYVTKQTANYLITTFNEVKYLCNLST